MKITHIKTVLCTLLASLFLASHALGAVIVWDTPTNVVITDPTQISNVGTFFTSYTAYGSDLTINGVTFTYTPGNVTLAPHGQALGGSTTGNDYSKLLSTGDYISNGTSSTTPSVISGLTIGQTYLIQIWTPYWDHNYTTALSSSAPTSGSSATAPDQSAYLNLGVGGIPPQFITGTFTATSTTQNFYTVASETYGIVASLQVRAVPEPTTIALVSLGVLALVIRRRYRRCGNMA